MQKAPCLQRWLPKVLFDVGGSTNLSSICCSVIFAVLCNVPGASGPATGGLPSTQTHLGYALGSICRSVWPSHILSGERSLLQLDNARGDVGETGLSAT